MGSKSAKDPSACDRTHDSQDDIQKKTLALLIHNFAGDEPGDNP